VAYVLLWLAAGLIFFAVAYALLKRVPLPGDLAWLKEVLVIVGVGVFLLWIVYLLSAALGVPMFGPLR
jgi:hypothetical protein